MTLLRDCEEMPEASPGTTGGEGTAQPAASAADTEPPTKAVRRRRLLRIGKVILVVIVLYAIGRHVWRLYGDWTAQGQSISLGSVSIPWLVLATATYVGGQICYAAFWGRLLRAMGMQASWLELVRAYGVGTGGKYVPGKALVVVIRTAMVRASGVGRIAIGLATVYETAVMMAVGSALSCICLAVALPDKRWLWLATGGAAVGMTACLHPAIFGRLAKFASLPFKETRRDFSAGACYAVFWRSVAIPIAGWGLLGLSFWMTLQSIGLPCSSLTDMLLLIGATALATAVGFLVLFMPAGIGVREFIIISVLAPVFGGPQIVLGSLLLRTVWTVAELAFAGLLYVRPSRPGEADGASPERP